MRHFEIEVIRELVKAQVEYARSKGFDDDYSYRPADILAQLMLIVDEVSEAAQVVRQPVDSPPDIALNNRFVEELADIVLRVFTLAGMLNLDIGTAMAQKIISNSRRSYRHGNKRL